MNLIDMLVQKKGKSDYDWLIKKLIKKNNEVECYKNREFGNSHNIDFNNKNLFNQYQHIKQKIKNYLIFDIDYINIDKCNILFYNDFFTPNFYIYEYSKNKKCYTLQVFVLLDKKFILTDIFKQKYKKLCALFGADLNYQIATGIHKNPNFYSDLVVFDDLFNIQIPLKNHCGFLHDKRYNFDNFYSHLEFFGYFNNLPETPENIESEGIIEVKTGAVNEVKKVVKPTKKNTGFRNNELFEKTRNIVYSMSEKNYETVLHIANKINNDFALPLKKNEVVSTAKSIHKFIIENFKNEKVDPYSDFQRQKSAETRNKKAIAKIEDAIFLLLKHSKNVSPSSIKKITNQNIHTIKNLYEDVLNYCSSKQLQNVDVNKLTQNSTIKNLESIHNNFKNDFLNSKKIKNLDFEERVKKYDEYTKVLNNISHSELKKQSQLN